MASGTVTLPLQMASGTYYDGQVNGMTIPAEHVAVIVPTWCCEYESGRRIRTSMPSWRQIQKAVSKHHRSDQHEQLVHMADMFLYWPLLARAVQDELIFLENQRREVVRARLRRSRLFHVSLTGRRGRFNRA